MPRYAVLTTQNAAAAVERKEQKAGRVRKPKDRDKPSMLIPFVQGRCPNPRAGSISPIHARNTL